MQSVNSKPIKVKYVILLIFAILLSVIMATLPPLVLESIVNNLANGIPVMWQAAVLYFSIVALSGFAEAGKEGIIVIFGQQIMHWVRNKMCLKLNRLPASYFVDHAPGETVSYFTNDVQTIDDLFSSGIISMIADICKMACVLFVIYKKSLGLGIILTFTTPILFVLTRYFQKRTQIAQTENLRAISSANQQIPETQKNIQTIRLLKRQSYMVRRYRNAIDDSYNAQERSNFYDAIYSPIIVFVSSAIIGIVMALSVKSGDMKSFFGMSVGTAAAVIAYVGSFFEPLESIGIGLQNIQSAVSGIRRIREFLNENERPQALQQTVSFKPGTPIVTLSNVNFTYDKENQILNNFSLQVNEGDNIVLMGRTGAGKSTILKLIAGLYIPNSGNISVCGQNPALISESEMRKTIGYVQQGFYMIKGCVAEQISLKDPQITEEQILKAIKTVGLEEAVSNLPKGIYTECSESTFSQGQFQLLSIARAIVMNPKLMLFDEITANLDAQTETMVLKALDAVAEGRTTISISHHTFENLTSNKKQCIYV